MRRQYGDRLYIAMSNDNTSTIVAAFALILLAFLIVWIVAKAVEKDYARGTIDSRGWDYIVRVKYDNYECGYGLNYSGDMEWQCDWETYTRCSVSNSGLEPPIVRPEVTCPARRSGDYERDDLSLYVRYHEDDSTQSETYRLSRPSEWLELSPGTKVDIEKSLLSKRVTPRR